MSYKQEQNPYRNRYRTDTRSRSTDRTIKKPNKQPHDKPTTTNTQTAHPQLLLQSFEGLETLAGSTGCIRVAALSDSNGRTGLERSEYVRCALLRELLADYDRSADA